MAKPGQRSDRSAARIRSESGEAVGSVLLMIDLEGEHRAQNGVRQMIVAGITCEISVEMLDGMVYVFLSRNLFVVAVQLRFTIFLRTVFRNLCCGENGMWRKIVECIRRGGLLAAALVGFGWRIGLNAQNHGHKYSSFSIMVSTSRMNSSSVLSQSGSILCTSSTYSLRMSFGKCPAQAI